jgi:hypothetical protein
LSPTFRRPVARSCPREHSVVSIPPLVAPTINFWIGGIPAGRILADQALSAMALVSGDEQKAASHFRYALLRLTRCATWRSMGARRFDPPREVDDVQPRHHQIAIRIMHLPQRCGSLPAPETPRQHTRGKMADELWPVDLDGHRLSAASRRSDGLRCELLISIGSA